MASFGPPGGTPPPPPPGAPPPPFPGQPPMGGPVVRPPRPTTVTLAAGLMFLAVALSLIGAVIALLNRNLIRDSVQRSIDKQGSSGSNVNVDTVVNITMGFAVVVALIVALAFIVLAVFDLRGSNVARIITWVVCGLFLCCSGFGAVSAAVNDANLPGWYTAYTTISVVLQLLIYIAVIVLLAMPPSNAYFKPKPQDQLY